MHTLIENNTFIKADKYNTHQEDTIGCFKYINPILTLQRTTRENVTDTLFQVYLEVTLLSKVSKKKKDLLKSISLLLTSTTRQLKVETGKVVSPQAHMKSGVTPIIQKL